MFSRWLPGLNRGLATPTGRIAQLVGRSLSRSLQLSSGRSVPGESSEELVASGPHFLLFSIPR